MSMRGFVVRLNRFQSSFSKLQRTSMLLLGAIAWLCPAIDRPLQAEDDAQRLEFFETKIRPVLVKHCYECHSAKAEASGKLKGGLRLDSKTAMLTGGESGAAVVPGKPDDGSLIGALKYDSFQMPPKQKLPESIVADFVKWIELGAIDPRVDDAPKTIKKGIDIQAGREHWSYRPLQPQATPAVKNEAWPSTQIDRFILAKLEEKQLTPSRDADRTALIRRLYFDLIGLPPTPQQIDEFLADTSSTAYEQLVDRLLESPHFGERWGRHWLDVARFGESLTLRGFVLKDAWRYRDYVIDAFNSDLPYDQFVREQVAGDLLISGGDDLATRRRKLTATSYLAIGNTNLEEQDKQTLVMDVVDEQLETIGKGILAQTIGCARCHDHKFDPIPTKDYYALAGILKNSKTLEHSNVSKWLEVPLPMPADQEAAFEKLANQITALKDRIAAEKKLAKADAKATDTPTKKSRKSIAISELVGIVVDDTQAKKVGSWTESQHTNPYVGDGYLHDAGKDKGEKTLTFDPEIPANGRYEVRLAYSASAGRATDVPVTIFSADGEKTVMVDETDEPNIDGAFISLGQYRFEATGQSFVLVSTEGTKGIVTADAVVFIPVEKLTATTTDSKKSDSKDSSADTAKPAAPQNLKQLEDELKQLEKTAQKRDTAVSVMEEKNISDLRVHVRGSVKNLGDKAPRGFLQVATYGDVPPMPAQQSGRRELADWLTNKSNPLPARVMVNRAWHWLFGIGLVRTTDNFGTTGEKPSHPELLDSLALEFVNDGWSTKRLVRRLVMSRTYRLSTETSEQNLAADPENRLFSRMNRRRLDAECIRDAILQISGKLQRDYGGPSFDTSLNSDFGFQHKDSRRSVYSPVFRNAIPELFDVFDAADPSLVTGRRNVSTVAPQALFLMNHPFIIEQARHTATQLLAAQVESEDARIVFAYRTILGRIPTAAEVAVSNQFLKSNGTAADRWTLLVQSLFGSIEFRYSN